MNDELIEKMARAICEEDHKGGDFGMMGIDAWEEPRGREVYIARARAALSVIHGEGKTIVPREPTEAQCDGLARDLITWHEVGNRTPRALFYYLKMLRREIPNWLRDEPEMQALDHVPSKKTLAALIYRAMIREGEIK